MKFKLSDISDWVVTYIIIAPFLILLFSWFWCINVYNKCKKIYFDKFNIPYSTINDKFGPEYHRDNL